MARPKKPIDDNAVFAMAERQWSTAAIAAVFGVNETTIARRYAAKLEECRNSGKAKLIDKLYELAFRNDDVQALKYLCDRILGPVERKHNLEMSGAGIKVSIVDYGSKQ